MANPLASKPIASQDKHPAHGHAQMWQHVNSMAPDEQASKMQELQYSLPVIGALASNPKITRKDVIKAAADAAGSGKIDPSMAVSFISQMPNDPDKIQPWLKGLYAANLSAMVHLKAASMPAQQQPQPAQPGMPPQAALQGVPPQ